MYIVFKSMDEWFKKEPSLYEKYSSTYNFIYTGAYEFAQHMSNSVREKANLDIKIEFSEILLKQSLIDAFDDLLRLKNYHPTNEPNPIKEMSYIVYWLMRHKPIRLATEEAIECHNLSNIARAKLLFINEYFGVKLLVNAAFEGSIKNSSCDHMFSFGEKQIKYFKHFLLYYLVYRMDSPKSLEAIMLGCTIHPVWEVNPAIWDNPQSYENDF